MVIVAQMVRVTHCECEGREFKSHLSPNMVFVAEWTMAQVCGTCISQVRILSNTQQYHWCKQ